MTVRFIVGRAGSGKTHCCLTAIRDRLRRSPIDGPRLVLLVPEQAALQMERTLIAPDEIGASHRAEVLSFRRLAHRVMDDVGAPQRQVLSECARAMALRNLIARQSEQLQYYRRVRRLAGFVARLGATITELIQEEVDPDDLRIDDAPSAEVSSAQRAKLHDLRKIYRAYLEYLGTTRVDPSQQLAVARTLLPECKWLDGAEVWVDGFASLMRQETLTLVALARRCKQVEITLLLDPALCRRQGRGGAAGATSLFGKTHRTYLDMCRTFEEAGVGIDEPIVCAARPLPRFASSTSLARLESTLARGWGGRTDEGTSPSEDAVAEPSPVIELAHLPSRRVEVDYAVSKVCHWVQDEATDYRYRDIAIIARDLAPYHDLLTAALAARDIPFFIDQRRSIAHHALVEFLRASVDVAASDMAIEAVGALLKTGVMPISSHATDELENDLLARGVRGYVAWTGADWVPAPVSEGSSGRSSDARLRIEQERLARINDTRRTLIALIDPWFQFATEDGGRTGAEWAAAIAEWFEGVGAEARIEQWALRAEDDGDIDQASAHRQVWRDCASFLDDMGAALSEFRLSIGELSDIIEAGLSTVTLGLAPPMVDQLLVGSIERSRHPNIKAVVIIGFNDGLFPGRPAEDPVIHDDDRALLRDRGLDIRPPARQRALDEPLLLYIAVTRASEQLVITCATSDGDGRALRPSPYESALLSACPGFEVRTVPDAALSRELWDILSPADLPRRLVGEMRARAACADDDTEVRGRWNELYECARRDLLHDPASRRALASLAPDPRASLSRGSVERICGVPLRVSVSQLETYAACPFQHFAKYALRLREREEAALAPVDVGRVHHAVLDDFVGSLAARDGRLDQMADLELFGALQQSCDRVAAGLDPDGFPPGARDAYVRRRTASELARVLRGQRRVAGAGRAKPKATELPFGFDALGGLPALALVTPMGHRIELRGFIDRVDLAELADETLGIVIDYKRTRGKHLDLSDVYHGLSLQLLGYLLVLAQHGHTLAGRPVTPVAALYVGLRPSREVVSHPSEVSERTLALPESLRPRGLIRADRTEALTGDSGDPGWSAYYSLYHKKDGSAGQINRSDAADASGFEALLAQTRRRLGELADGILDGAAPVHPCRLGNFSPCSWCPMGSVCGFETGLSDIRFLEKLQRSEILARLTNGTSAADRCGNGTTQ